MKNIYFFNEDIDFKIKNKRIYSKNISQLAEKEQIKIKNLNYIFCSDPYLLNINKCYLSHDYLTDIITFNFSENFDTISGDVFISLERAKENALTYKVDLENEICRLLIHGVLHLIGYLDGTTDERLVMREKEDYYLSLWSYEL